MNIPLADVTLHIDENLAAERRHAINGKIRAMSGIASVLNTDAKPHLAVVRYDPELASADAILAMVRSEGVHAELIGL